MIDWFIFQIGTYEQLQANEGAFAEFLKTFAAEDKQETSDDSKCNWRGRTKVFSQRALRYQGTIITTVRFSSYRAQIMQPISMIYISSESWIVDEFNYVRKYWQSLIFV